MKIWRCFSCGRCALCAHREPELMAWLIEQAGGMTHPEGIGSMNRDVIREGIRRDTAGYSRAGLAGQIGAVSR